VRVAVLADRESVTTIEPVPRTVLIVDDHPSFRSSARLLLETEGWRVVGEAEDGAGGVAAARELKPDVVLLDVNLPDIDGFECAHRLSRNGAAPAVVLVSSRTRGDLGEKVETCGARGFISKAELSAAAVEALVE
jgi:DNA-binding NarL/FixJ family response regulator